MQRPDSVRIRFANKRDFRSVRRFDPHSRYLDPKKIARKVANREIILALAGTKLVGILKFSYFWQTRPYIDLIFVDSDYRGTGVSVFLLQFLERFLKKERYAYLFSSSEKKDKNAQAWHRHVGFKNMGELRDINLPHGSVAEVFFSKRISNVTTLRKYSL